MLRDLKILSYTDFCLLSRALRSCFYLLSTRVSEVSIVEVELTLEPNPYFSAFLGALSEYPENFFLSSLLDPEIINSA